MTLPVAPLRLPSTLAGATNGRLLAGALVDIGGSHRLERTAARSYRALVAAMAIHGLSPSLTGAYRPYDVQVSLFLARYSPSPLVGRPTKIWQGQTWWLKPGMATAATPGTSNHGWGLAVDFAQELDGDPAPESVTGEWVLWMCDNAATYGWSAELQNEPWHWRAVHGDDIPPAVLAYERLVGAASDPTPIPLEDMMIRFRGDGPTTNGAGGFGPGAYQWVLVFNPASGRIEKAHVWVGGIAAVLDASHVDCPVLPQARVDEIPVAGAIATQGSVDTGAIARETATELHRRLAG